MENKVKITASNVICFHCQMSYLLKRNKDNDFQETISVIEPEVQKIIIQSPAPIRRFDYSPYMYRDLSYKYPPFRSNFLHRYDYVKDDMIKDLKDEKEKWKFRYKTKKIEEKFLIDQIRDSKILSLRNAFANSQNTNSYKYDKNFDFGYSRDKITLPLVNSNKLIKSVNILPGNNIYQSKFRYHGFDK